MRIRVLTLFPEMFDALKCSVLGRAIDKGVLSVEAFNIRDYTADKHGKCDDTPFGGGAGMLMTAQPVVSAIRSLDENRTARRIYLSPQGRVLTAETARRLSAESDIILLCGHYEGIDQRAIDLEVDEEISVGDYVLTGGELPAMVLIDCISRFIPGVLGSEVSAEDESFSDGLLEYPQYTKPRVFEGLEVPEVLLSGHHAEIDKWRRRKALEKTAAVRPDLLEKKNEH